MTGVRRRSPSNKYGPLARLPDGPGHVATHLRDGYDVTGQALPRFSDSSTGGVRLQEFSTTGLEHGRGLPITPGSVQDAATGEGEAS